MNFKQVAILGGGNMGSAIARAFWENEDVLRLPSNEVVIAEPDGSKHAALREGNESSIVASAREAIKMLAPGGIVVVAVKPQMFGTLAAEVGDVGTRLVISVMAGTAAARVHRDLGGHCRVVRAMPNLAVADLNGVTGICEGPGATEQEVHIARTLFAHMGRCIDIPESMMDAMTAVASSGLAYIFYFVEAMTKAAIEVGFTPEVANRIAKDVAFGAAWMLLDDASAEDLRRRVTSKGGTTQAATDVLDAAGVPEIVTKAIKAARDRGRELSQS